MSASAVDSPFVASGFASIIKPSGELALVFAESLVKGIDAASFYFIPSPVKDSKLHSLNSAGFNLGHLSIYPDARILRLLGREDLVRPLPYDADLFKVGSPDVERPNTYPAMDVVVRTFFERYRAVLDVLPTIPDSVFMGENPMEGRMKDLFPTIGAAVNFLVVGRTQSHLGQISVWRRLMGLGGAL